MLAQSSTWIPLEKLLQCTLESQGIWSSMCECVLYAGATNLPWQLDTVRVGCRMNRDGGKQCQKRELHDKPAAEGQDASGSPDVVQRLLTTNRLGDLS